MRRGERKRLGLMVHFVVGVDEDVVFALFEPLEDECLVVVVFLLNLQHPTATLSLNVQHPLTKPKHQSSNLEIEALTSKNINKLREFKTQAKSFLTLQASLEANFKEGESGEECW